MTRNSRKEPQMMKKMLISIGLLAVLLTGCGKTESLYGSLLADSKIMEGSIIVEMR